MFCLLVRLHRNKHLPCWIWSIGGDNAGWANFYIDLLAGISFTMSGNLD